MDRRLSLVVRVGAQIAALAGLFVVWMCGAVLAEPRIALVIGNGAYGSVTQLDNPVPDAQLIAGTLQSTGFEVVLLTDADQVTLNRAIAQFGRDLREAGPEATGLFFYAGHGVQSFGSNYLIPTDAQLTDAADVSLVGVQAEAVLRQMSSASNKTNIVILDACRNNPFENIPDMDDNGLAEMKAPTGTFLAYSTAPGAVALDGLDGNSPFSGALARQIPLQGVPIEQLFKQVRNDVLSITKGIQTPWDTSSLTEDFFFEPPVTLSPADLEARQLWDSVRQSRDPVQIMLFMRGYPDSAFADDARNLLTEVMQAELAPNGGAATAPDEPAVTAPTAPVEADASERDLIELARQSGLALDYEAYLKAFPTGVYAELAAFELSILAEKEAERAAQNPAPEAEPETAPVVAEPVVEAAPDDPVEVRFDMPIEGGSEVVLGRTLEELIQGSPLFPPIEGLPEEVWKDKHCSNCHNWTKEALCTQGGTYLAKNGTRALAKQHPYGGGFKRSIKIWAEGGCQ